MFGITINKADLHRDLNKSKQVGNILLQTTGVTAKTLWLIGQEASKLIIKEIKSK